ncbi:hypothetical protein ABIF62_004220 [Bradyrhizobium japonicum]
MRRGAAIAAVAIALGVSGVGAYRLAPAPAPAAESAGWREIAWPFPRDGWPAGRAFRCDGACAGTELYVRAKRGFCNCDRGVADDDEVDRVADVDLISPRFAAVAPGEEVDLARCAAVPGAMISIWPTVSVMPRSASPSRAAAISSSLRPRGMAKPASCSVRRWRSWRGRR